MLKLVRFFYANEKGATLIEYGLLAALIAVAAIAAMLSIGENLEATFENVATELEAGSN